MASSPYDPRAIERGTPQLAAPAAAAEADRRIGRLERDPDPAMVKIGDFTFSGGALVFASIPQNFTHLEVRAALRSTRALASAGGRVRWNGLSGAFYFTGYDIHGNAPNNGAQENNATGGYVGQIPAANTNSRLLFGRVKIELPFYRDLNMERHALCEAHIDDSVNMITRYRSTITYLPVSVPTPVAITDLYLNDDVYGSLHANSRATLYGIR